MQKHHPSFTLIEHKRVKRACRNESFTLIELLIVIAIIAILSAVIV
ncbi:MAG TPA: prepilin-type N-terminal cleavage/methylation domain-containing protein, partial [Candidatus Pacearchaeota archaeon]|nr:prepilin-type N-terminal cleavage/methylation domain-containing protein [Candidatus Pacearchaeota archaeon]